jgi:hypothetical protein
MASGVVENLIPNFRFQIPFLDFGFMDNLLIVNELKILLAMMYFISRVILLPFKNVFL